MEFSKENRRNCPAGNRPRQFYQGYWKSSLITTDVETPSSPPNPYNRMVWSKWSPSDRDDEGGELKLVKSLPHFEYDALLRSHLESCVCHPRDFQVSQCGKQSFLSDNMTTRKTKSPLPTIGSIPADAAVRFPSPKKENCCKAEWMRKLSYRKIKAKVEKAVKTNKIFLIRGQLPKLKEALEQRGWLQKYETTRTRLQPYGSSTSLESQSVGDITLADGSLNERAVIFALLRHHPPDFIWDCRNDFIEWPADLKTTTLLNRYEKSNVYTSKLGMARLLQHAHWFHEEKLASVRLPRSYNPCREVDEFIADFRMTAATSLLMWFFKKMRQGSELFAIRENAVAFECVELATKLCEEFVERELDDVRLNVDKEKEFAAAESTEAKEMRRRGEVIEAQIDLWDRENQAQERKLEKKAIREKEWEMILEAQLSLVHRGHGLIEPEGTQGAERIQHCLQSASSILEAMLNIDPQFKLNGTGNVWILKPSNLCCGSGIRISHDLSEILRRVEKRSKDYFVVQKYIERPLLVHGTKFDIRQWYLVTSTYPLTIWVFREAFLRFSSKPYSMSTYHEAIHICNTAIQERYDEKKKRKKRHFLEDSKDGSMSIREQGWECSKLNEYLKKIGHGGEPYYDVIYPKISEAIVLLSLASQEHMDKRRCSFELYGADFVVTEDLEVWLIEINTNPRMHPPSTRVTKRLYNEVLDGLVKVIMDLPLNSYANTGGFELVYKQNVPEFRPYLGPGLFVLGKSVPLQSESKRHSAKDKEATISNPWGKQHRTWSATDPPTIPRQKDYSNVVDFIDFLNKPQCTAAN